MPSANTRSDLPALATQFRGRLGLAGQTWTAHEALVDHRHTPDDIQDPAYWWPVSKSLKVWDVIEARCEDSTWTASLRVMGLDEKLRRVIVVLQTPVTYFEPSPLPDGFQLDFVGGGVGWRIVQEGRLTPVRQGFATHIEAAAWLSADRRVDTSLSDAPAAAPPRPPTDASKKSKKGLAAPVEAEAAEA